MSAIPGVGEAGFEVDGRPCRFFAKGNCMYGDRCIYRHASPPSSTTASAMALPISAAATVSSSSTLSSREAHHVVPPPVVPPPVVDMGGELSFRFQALKVKGQPAEKNCEPRLTKIDSSWVDVPEFVPRFAQAKPSYSSAAGSSPGVQAFSLDADDRYQAANITCPTKSWAEVVNPVVMAEVTVIDAESQLCPFGAIGECRYGEHCAYIHGDICDMCGKSMLHPFHEQQRRHHQNLCVRQHEEQMELSFAVAKSREKTCGICMEIVMDKPKGEARFGILPNCNHCFCLLCLRKWRQAKFEHKIIRSCPECRQTSDYICPSRFWVDTKEEKEKLLSEYKNALNSKECKYYRRGEGECPFGNRCFYRHVTADGKEIDIGPPSRRPRRSNADGELILVQRLLYDFLEEREGRLVIPLEYLDFLEMLSDSDSEYEVIL